MTHAGHLQGAWPTGCPLPPEDPAKLTGPLVGEIVLLRGKSFGFTWVDGERQPLRTTPDRFVRVVARSYVWSPNECRHNGGYRRYDWTVVDDEHGYRVVVDDTDLITIKPGPIL